MNLVKAEETVFQASFWLIELDNFELDIKAL